MLNDSYIYGIAAMCYLTTCWTFSAIRWWHTCRAPKDRLDYIWPDRKLQVLVYLIASILLPYIINPANEAAWALEKSYFPATYFFYCGLLLLCFFGTVKQWRQWKKVSWTAASIVILTMLPLVLNAWLPQEPFSKQFMDVWHWVVMAESILMMGYAAVAMWQVKRWMNESRDDNYSNPEDFPTDYANRVWLAPGIFTPLLWPAFLFDSPMLMAIQNVLLAALNIMLLINVMPVWRRMAILSSTESEEEQVDEIHDEGDDDLDGQLKSRIDLTAMEIENYVVHEKAYLNAHLKIADVVEHCTYSRSYVSMTFKQRFGGFANYINRQRLRHFEQFMEEHPELTKEAAVSDSGFASYNAYYKAKVKYGEL